MTTHPCPQQHASPPAEHTAHRATRAARRSRPAALTTIVGTSVLLALLSACAGVPQPREEMAVGRAAVDRATAQAGTDASTELAAATDKIARAHVAYADKDYTLARQLAEQAEADATLAEAQARSARSTRALAEVRQGIAQLRDEMVRK